MAESRYERDDVEGLKLVSAKELRSDPTQGWLYAVGNINGRSELLLRMIDEIEHCNTLCANDRIVFMGNYISQTGDAEKVLDILQSYEKYRPQQAIFLRGANEHRMLRSKINFFRSELGKNVLGSYGEYEYQYKKPAVNELRISKFLEHQTWLESLPLFYRTEKFFFVHSGVDPDRAIEHQNIGGFMFIKGELEKTDKVFDRIIVHSSFSGKSDIKKNRISIGAGVDKNTLNCICLNDKRDANNPKEFGKVLENIFSVSKP